MNGTDHFKRTIQAYLDSRAAEDKLFAASYSKPNKNMDDCITYCCIGRKANAMEATA